MPAELVPPPFFETVARRFRVLGEPVRLRLLDVLQERGEQTVQQLVTATGQSQANVSKHLRVLLDEGIVARRQEGVYAHYRVADPTLAAVCLLVCSRLKAEQGG